MTAFMSSYMTVTNGVIREKFFFVTFPYVCKSCIQNAQGQNLIHRGEVGHGQLLKNCQQRVGCRLLTAEFTP